MNRPRRTHAEARARMSAGILRLGNAQLETVGAAGLSVREIARGLGVASSAIYRHVKNRDELLTLLIVDAYDDLADSALAADDPADPPGERLASLARGVRGWAVRHPARWGLAYGTPVPGYEAPAERTGGPGTRVMAAFLAIIAPPGEPASGVRESDPAPGAAGAPLSAELSEELSTGAAELGSGAPPQLVAAGVAAWTSLVGLVSAEVFAQLGADLARHGEEFLERWIAETAARFGLERRAHPEP